MSLIFNPFSLIKTACDLNRMRLIGDVLKYPPNNSFSSSVKTIFIILYILTEI